MAVEERKQYTIPVNVVSKTEIYKGIGGNEALRILVVGLLGLIPFLLLAAPKVADTEIIFVEVTPAPLAYNESGEDVDIEANMELLQSDYGLTEYVEEEVTIMVNKYPVGKRLLFIVIPMAFMTLLCVPIGNSISTYDYIGHALKFSKSQKQYYYRRFTEDE